MRIAGTANLFSSRRPPPGARPGEFVVPEDAHPTTIRAIAWDHERLDIHEIRSAEELQAITAAPGLTWIEVVGLGDGSVLNWIRDVLGVHPLAVADIANVPQRPKFEDYGDRDLLIAQHARILEDEGVELTQVSIVAGPDWVVSVLEDPCDLFEPLHERLRANAPIRRNGSAFLAYAMVDAVIDGYFPVIESLGELLEDLEEEIMDRPGRDALTRLHAVRRVLLTLHRTMWRQRDALGQILRGDGNPFGEEVRVYFRDAHDHSLQVLDAIESYREITVGLMDVYLSSISNRLNEVMKTLTIMATIFIPLTFIVGIYGMNFDHMPELRWRWGYFAVWGVMIAVSLTLLWWFRRRGWLGNDDDTQE